MFVGWTEQFNEAIRDVARREKAPLIDLAALYDTREELMYDAFHVTAKGSLVVVIIGIVVAVWSASSGMGVPPQA